jgi:hypothetical protein
MDDVQLEPSEEMPERSASRPPGIESFPAEIWLGLKAWARHTFSRASLISTFKSLMWVIPLSFLIWAWAEREESVKDTAVPLSLNVLSPDPTHSVRLVVPMDAKLRADLSGPNGKLQVIRDQYETGAKAVQIELPESVVSQVGEHQVSSSILNDSKIFSNNGVTASDILPPFLTVDVDVLEDVTVDVAAPPDISNLAAAPIFEPRKVTVRAAHSVIQSARDDGKLIAYADIKSAREALTPGVHDLTGVPVTVPFAVTAITPATVSAHVEMKKSDVSVTLPAIPVWVVYPPGMEDKYKAVYDPTLANVTVIGPEEQIRALQSPTFEPKPKATFEVSASDLPTDTDRQGRLRFDLPADIHVSSEDARRMITFHLVERKPVD